MTLLEAVKERHAVRNFKDIPVAQDIAEKLTAEIEKINSETGLHIQLCLNEPEAFHANKTHYGQFSGCKNYIALIGPKGQEVELGYWGEHLVLIAQTLGLNSCWVAMTFSKNPEAYKIEKGEKLTDVIAIGYGVTQGNSHKIKAPEHVSSVEDENVPEWFRAGVECALLAPTAMNQQKFKFILKDEKVSAKAGLGFCVKTDLGIVKYHFELGAGKENFKWE